jgi:hypothetical protein
MHDRRKLLLRVPERRQQTLDAPERQIDRLRMQFLQLLEQAIARSEPGTGRGPPDAMR